ncbi:Methionine--tRNA ligase [Carnobacterium maltaromaticum]|uniref:DUF2829 domain-containing protein n=1 Tax=Carnobacterium maltaromaticum TaxID=2751 RepID=UPI00191B970D|nr:DUF2829 domain-containing protein [Carnobacterium maltaromaticum]CAD5901717.1 Methionine--tRNA ligase [Carnobacterium maltaromaticum]
MTFEEILPHLKNGKKIIRSGWGGFELFVFLEPTSTHKGSTLNPYFLIKTADEGYTMFSPTVCDILAEDWEIVQ